MVVRPVVARQVAVCRVAAPMVVACQVVVHLVVVLPAGLLVTPWAAVLLEVARRAVRSPGCPPAEWVTAVAAPMVKVAKMAASPVVDSAVARAVISLATSANSPAADKVLRNLVKNWTSRSAISMRHSVKNSVRLRQ